MVLLLHRGPIENFILVSDHAFNGTIGRWMDILSRNGIKDLKLRFEDQEICMILFQLFSCISLEHMYLSGCSINFNWFFQGFKLIRTLTLSNFDSLGISIENLVLGCPLLERLSLTSFLQQGCLRILAPNLTVLFIVGEFHDICLETPKLASACICLVPHNIDQKFNVPNNSKESNITRALGRLSNIQSLEIYGDFTSFLTMGPIPENIPPIFNHLTEIFMHLPLDPDEIAVALCLFQNAPNLEEIRIEFWPSRRRDHPVVHNSWEAKAIHDLSLFNGLKVVNIVHSEFFELSLQSAKSILEFAKLVLSTAAALEKLYVNDLEDAKVIFEVLQYFPKLSKKAQILFVKSSDEE